MLELILKLYTMSMIGDVRSPLPHLVGPPGCGKSTSVEEAAKIIGCKLHILNVSRLSPLELEGVQMPMDMHDPAQMRLAMLTATYWTQLKDGDIVLFDEFLRGFPEIYNGLLDIITSRQVGLFKLPKVFFIAASNSTTAYDKALEDRLIHLPVDDPRTSKKARGHLAGLIIDGIGLSPKMADSPEMLDLLTQQVLPMYEILDKFKQGGSAAGNSLQGKSVRNLIGQAKLRQVETPELKELLAENNRYATNSAKWQYLVLLDGKSAPPAYISALPKIPHDRLTPLQLTNLQLNEQLIEMEAIRNQKEGVPADDDDLFA